MKTYKKIRGSYYEDAQVKGHKSQSWFYKSREAYLIDFAKLKKTDTVLDIGCGSGMVARKIAKKTGCSLVGIDISDECIKYAKEAAKKEKIKNIEFKSGAI